MTFDEYLAFIATPENLRREGSQKNPRRDWSTFLRQRYEKTRLSEAQLAVVRWLASQPNGPAKILMISEEWSSDCRRDLGSVQRIAEAGGMELRIFTRDGHYWGGGSRPEPDAPNADLLTPFLREKDGETFLSIPVVAFFTRDFELLYRYLEFPAIYHKDRLRGRFGVPQPGESPEQTRKRSEEDYAAMLASPIFDVWADAAIDEMISMLHERLVVGSLA
jgi:hypothetical protein